MPQEETSNTPGTTTPMMQVSNNDKDGHENVDVEYANIFTTSTHATHWVFKDLEELQVRRARPHQKAQQRVVALARTNDGNAIQPTGGGNDSAAGSATPNVTLLTLYEETQLILYYTLTVPSIAAKFTPPLPDRVQHTAMTYLKRFYLNYSCMDYHPMKILVTCTLLACKIEEHYVSPQRLAEKLSTSAAQTDDKLREIVKLEVPVLEGIEFHLKVFHPHRAIRGLLRQLQHSHAGLTNEQINALEANIATIHQRALQYCNFVYRTDAIFLFTHSQLALGAIICAANATNQTEYVDKLLTLLAKTPESMPILKQKVDAMLPYFKEGESVVVADVLKLAGKIDKKLKKVINLSLDPTSEEYAMVQAKKESEKERRREDKLRKRRLEEEAKTLALLGPSNSNSMLVKSLDEDDGEEFVIMKRARGSEVFDPNRQERIDLRRKHSETSNSGGFGPQGYGI